MNQLAVVGFHGHTIRHLPDEDATWQIGNASLLSQSLACPVVSDFRRRDMAAGGQGAPLVPLFHRMLLASQTRPFAVLNLGGVANVTWVDENGNVTAGDTGPGCGLLDTWIESKVGQRFDLDGKLAAEGTIHIETVNKALTDPYFARPIPKSADRFDFESISVEHLSVEDGAATLCAITTTAVSQAIKTLGNPHTVWVTGGGANHPLVMSLLQDSFDSVQPVSRANLRSNSLEAECFAWLAVRRLAGLPTTLPETTGCRVPTCGGLLTI